MKRRITPESSLLKACTDLLSAERIWWMRMNTGAMKDGKRFVRFGKPGMGDILSGPWVVDADDLWQREFLWLELKSESGRQTEKQKEFQLDVEADGQKYLLIRDVDELRNWLKEHGAIGGIR